jgi:ribonuclease HI
MTTRISRPTLPAETIWVFCDGSTGMTSSAVAAVLAVERAPQWGMLERLRKIFRAESRCAAAAIARDGAGRILDLAWQMLDVRTNNEAEYAGLLLGLELAERLRAQHTICVLDSAVVIGQMTGRFAVNSKALRTWHWRACQAARRLPEVRYCLVPREWNRLADGLAGQASIPWARLRAAIEDQAATLITESSRKEAL